ncbi:hypothetical protein DPMN_004280 [Dreissena polymorpha]|uniref:Uncharacterized protein n=1 Tax=Dreissena polymorpha TaxID=45954 RepID=A0A9D4RSV1_DREPO|nr:hypothetical protein DPMN_004280 [Dreissena polymorpha]
MQKKSNMVADNSPSTEGRARCSWPTHPTTHPSQSMARPGHWKCQKCFKCFPPN